MEWLFGKRGELYKCSQECGNKPAMQNMNLPQGLSSHLSPRHNPTKYTVSSLGAETHVTKSLWLIQGCGITYELGDPYFYNVCGYKQIRHGEEVSIFSLHHIPYQKWLQTGPYQARRTALMCVYVKIITRMCHDPDLNPLPSHTMEIWNSQCMCDPKPHGSLCNMCIGSNPLSVSHFHTHL